MANLQYVLHKGNKNTGSLKFVQPEAMQAVLEFHSGIAGYAQTPRLQACLIWQNSSALGRFLLRTNRHALG